GLPGRTSRRGERFWQRARPGARSPAPPRDRRQTHLACRRRRLVAHNHQQRSCEFLFDAVPAGEYVVSVEAAGFRANQRRVEVIPSGAAEVHFPLDIAQANQTVEVSAEVPPVDTQSSSSSTVIDRQAITAT